MATREEIYAKPESAEEDGSAPRSFRVEYAVSYVLLSSSRMAAPIRSIA